METSGKKLYDQTKESEYNQKNEEQIENDQQTNGKITQNGNHSEEQTL